MSLTGGLLVAGATSGAGKSTVTAGLCRSIARSGTRVAPFKAQNMSNHSAVTVDGGEVGRAQAMQAFAAGVDVETAMNPVLLKPTSDGTSHLVVRGREVGRAGAVGYGVQAMELRPVVLDAYAELRWRFDVVVAEGAGGAAEINLLERDLANLPLARATGMRSVLVVDIERGGAFAAAFGTIAILPDDLRATIAGVVFNRFRGEVSLLDPGIAELEARAGVPVLGVLPHLGPEPLLGVEDSLDVGTPVAATRSSEPVRVAVVRLPHLANPSDLDPLAVEPDVELTWATRPGELQRADLVIVPGSRATVHDLAWLRAQGLDRALHDTHAIVVGICAGQQMLGRRIVDDVESGVGEVAGLGLVDVDTCFHSEKVVRRRCGTADGLDVRGYQIHLGRASSPGDGWLVLDGRPEGAISPDGRVRTTSLHGLFDADGFRHALLTEVAGRCGRTFAPDDVAYAARLDAQHDRLAAWVDAHLDRATIDELIAAAPSPGEEPGW